MPTTATLSLSGALGLSVLGFMIVFFVLIVLMVVIRVIRSATETQEAPAAAAPAAAMAKAAAPAAPSGPPPGMIPAKGSFGEVKLHGVDDVSAALIMAIVADAMKAPLNELRFLSIREKK